MQPITNNLDPVYFPAPPSSELKPIKVITVRIHETPDIFQDVFCYCFQSVEGDYDGESYRPVYYTTVEIKMPLYVRPDGIKEDVEYALEENDISHEKNFTVNYTLAPELL